MVRPYINNKLYRRDYVVMTSLLEKLESGKYQVLVNGDRLCLKVPDNQGTYLVCNQATRTCYSPIIRVLEDSPIEYDIKYSERDSEKLIKDIQKYLVKTTSQYDVCRFVMGILGGEDE